ncbi:uncharacterized protein LOC110841346 isoform X2 [Zootermopsis nevadensis]|uniref:CHK kinase-like domain-containing protein n=2 Tax=Zootermopsis nevadensis TaxID=136037 RepID=A0A067RT58_ZOONE|nr:uncharacterized protein LOC110841346 isoform X2 [Zootermopsis nevadensis]KDR23004.1 hypothetical protein L798_02159 [Zootermopsis nevadensis]
MLYRVRVKGTDQEGKPWKSSVIYKCLPDNPVRRQAFKSDVLFRNEVAFYTKTLPVLLEFQASRDVSTPFRAAPRCYRACDTELVLEDLCSRGFVMTDRKAGLDADHCKAAMRELARLHALSLAMKLCRPEEFASSVVASVQEALFVPENEDWYRGYYNAVTRNALTMVREAFGDGTRYVDKFRDFVDDSEFFGRMVLLVKPQEPLAVLCHGDYWTNNILFRYSEDGEILEACMVDFQLARYGSPALDIVNLLYCCTSRETRLNHMADLLSDYHAALNKALRELTQQATDLKSDILDRDCLWQMIQEEIHRCGKYGLGLALDMIPISVCDSDQAPDLYVGYDGVTNALPVSTSSELCQQKMADLVQELVDSNDL